MKKSLLLVAALAAAAFAQAQPASAPKPKGEAWNEDFAGHKAPLLNHMDERALALTTLRTCVAAAVDESTIKFCHEAAHRRAEHMRGDRPLEPSRH